MENEMGHSENFRAASTLHKDCSQTVDLIFNLVKEVSDKSIEDIMSFIEKDCVEYSKEKEEIYNEHDINNTLRFNIFESISDKYRHENFHSDILYNILNPETLEIGRTYFANEFVKFLGVNFDCTKNFEVKQEEPTGKISWKDDSGKPKNMNGHIDLLIKNDKQAIIIENKIKYAPDQENQLVRYMKYVKEKLDLEIVAVVYLTLIDDKIKKPPLDGYDKAFEEYTKLLKDKSKGILKEVYAVDDKKSLAKNFLPECIERLKEEQPQDDNVKNACNLADVYIKQYKMLLEHLGGKAYMKYTDKKLIEEIYSNKDKFDAANDFAEFWNDKKQRNAALDEVLKEKLKEAFPKKNWTEGNLNGYDLYYCPSEFADDVFIFYCIDSRENPRQIGFASQEGKKFSKERRNELLDIIHKIRNKETESDSNNPEWVYCDINDTADLFKDVIEGLKVLFAATSE